MSFTYLQFGEGFDIDQPPSPALHFGSLLVRKGETLTIIHLTETSRDAYNEPVYTETSWTEGAFIIRNPGEDINQAGSTKTDKVIVYVTYWTAIAETGYEVEINTKRHHVISVELTRAYKKLTLARKMV